MLSNMIYQLGAINWVLSILRYQYVLTIVCYQLGVIHSALSVRVVNSVLSILVYPIPSIITDVLFSNDG